LFAIADRSAFSFYKITHGVNRMGELAVQVRDNLVVKIFFGISMRSASSTSARSTAGSSASATVRDGERTERFTRRLEGASRLRRVRDEL